MKINIWILLFSFNLFNFIKIAKSNEIFENFNDNKYYIISLKDSNRYTFNIESSNKENKSHIYKKNVEEVPKFNSIELDEIEEIISSHDCYREVYNKNLNYTAICDLRYVRKNKGEKILDIYQLEKELHPKEEFINKQITILSEIIIDNIDSYKRDEIVTEKIQQKIYKRNFVSFDDIFPEILKVTYTILDVTVIRAYLSKKLYKIISDLPNVVECIEDVEILFPLTDTNFLKTYNTVYYEKFRKNFNSNNNVNTTTTTNNNSNNNNNNYSTKLTYYNITDILNDTKWSDVSIQENSSNHLSIISQSKVDSNLISEYDTNYYYPSTAGIGVDIYFLDQGININHIDFDTTYRTVTCDAITGDGVYKKIKKTSKLYENCFYENEKQYHGIAVASAAAGTVNGVAKRANIHMIVINSRLSDYISSLKYVEDYADNPNKTVINISSGVFVYSNTLDKLISTMTRKGFMIISAAGNDGINSCITSPRFTESSGLVYEKNYPSSYVDVIGVGSIENNVTNGKIKKTEINNLYDLAFFSNYGHCVDIFAPGYANLAFIPENVKEKEIYNNTAYFFGTSFSSPMVAGVAAVLISEYSEITFNQNILKQMLIDLSVKDSLSGFESIDTPNRFLNIGKTVVYSSNNKYFGCGIRSGKKMCLNNDCCSAEGYCGQGASFCEIGCQSLFGHCSSNNRFPGKLKNEKRDIIINIYNYWMDLCIKYIPSNNIKNNLLLTICDAKDETFIWKSVGSNDSKFKHYFYEDICIILDNNRIAYAGSCEYGNNFKNIYMTTNRDFIQIHEYPEECLKPLIDDFNPYGITILTENTGLRVVMEKCSYEDEYQHWRLKEVPGNYFNFEDMDINGDIFEDNNITTDNDYYDDTTTNIDYYEDVTTNIDYYEDVTTNIDYYEDATNNDSDYDENIESSQNASNNNEINEKELFNGYIQSTLNKVIITNKKVVWIFNTELNLCLTYEENNDNSKTVLLKNCKTNDQSQQWLIPENNYGYYINVKNKNICINHSINKIEINDCIEYIQYYSKTYIKEKAAVIIFENDQLKVYNKMNNSKLCIDIYEEQKSDNKTISLNLNSCNVTNSHWKLKNSYDFFFK